MAMLADEDEMRGQEDEVARKKAFHGVWASTMRSPHYYACKEQSEG
jgi:hypothetical protein